MITNMPIVLFLNALQETKPYYCWMLLLMVESN